jgi:hypothetical protein
VRIERLLVIELRALLDPEDPFAREEDLNDYQQEKQRNVVAKHRTRAPSHTRHLEPPLSSRLRTRREY